VVVRAGPPFDADALRRSARSDRRLMLDAIGVAIAEVLPPENRGRYRDDAAGLDEARGVLIETRRAA